VIEIAFGSVNTWVANEGGNTMTKLLASTGSVVGTYDARGNPYGVAFDGGNIWVTDENWCCSLYGNLAMWCGRELVAECKRLRGEPLRVRLSQSAH
jgi:hypothetical protein